VGFKVKTTDFSTLVKKNILKDARQLENEA